MAGKSIHAVSIDESADELSEIDVELRTLGSAGQPGILSVFFRAPDHTGPFTFSVPLKVEATDGTEIRVNVPVAGITKVRVISDM